MPSTSRSASHGAAVRGSRRPHRRQVLVAALTASLAPAAFTVGNLPVKVLPARRQVGGPLTAGNRAVRRYRRQVIEAGLAASHAPAALKAVNLLGDVLPARRRFQGPSSARGRAVRGSLRPHPRQGFIAALAGSWAPAAFKAGNLIGDVLPARRHIWGPLPAVRRAVRGSCRRHRRQVRVTAMGASRAPAAIKAGGWLDDLLPAQRHVQEPLPARGGPAVAPGVLIGVRCSWWR